jgi:flagellar hook-basal body complex protein FliE
MTGPILPVNASLPPIGGVPVGGAQVGGAANPLTASGITATGGTASSGTAFQNVLAEAVQQVQQFQSSAAGSIGRFVSGEGEELHQVALATQQADLAFNLFMQVRNKVISAYQEVMRMQV